MRRVRLKDGHDFGEWRAAARALLLAGTPPDEVRWEEGRNDLFAATEAPAEQVTRRAVGVVPKRFVDLARVALFHEDPARLALLYRLLFRLQKDHTLLASRSDPDVSRLHKLCEELRARTRRHVPGAA